MAWASASTVAMNTDSPSSYSTPKKDSAAFTWTPDDLKKVEWIWPVIEDHLNKNWIYTFEQLADSDPVHLRSVLDQDGDRFINHHPDTWPSQAALARDGNRDKLASLQETLDKGRMA